MSKKSEAYWREREERQRQADLKSELTQQQKIDALGETLIKEINSQLDSFYMKYARSNGLTMAEVKKLADNEDIEEYARKTAKFAAEADFSKEAIKCIDQFELTAKSSRLELLMASINAEMANTTAETQKIINDALSGRALEEIERQASVYGKTVYSVGTRVQTLVNASFQNATWSSRLWKNQDSLRKTVSKSMRNYLVKGIATNTMMDEVKKELNSSVSNSTYCARRILVTERQRVAGQAQMEAYKAAGLEWYQFVAEPGCCETCAGLDGKKFKIDDAVPAVNLRPIHPNCRCQTLGANPGSDEDFDEWLESYAETGDTYEDFLQKKYNPESIKEPERKNELTEEELKQIEILDKRIANLQKKIDRINKKEVYDYDSEKQIKLGELTDCQMMNLKEINEYYSNRYGNRGRHDYEKELKTLQERINAQKNIRKYTAQKEAITRKDAVNYIMIHPNQLKVLGKDAALQYQVALSHAPKVVQDVWNKRGYFNRICDKKCSDGAYYAGPNDGIHYNLTEDMEGNSVHTPCATFFHESGHGINKTYVKNKGWCNYSTIYKDGAFTKAIDKDIKDMKGKMSTREFISTVKEKKYSSYQLADLSDIVEYPLQTSRPFGCGHGLEYWEKYNSLSDIRGNEAFAEMMSAIISSSESLEIIKEYLPTAYGVFMEMLESLAYE